MINLQKNSLLIKRSAQWIKNPFIIASLTLALLSTLSITLSHYLVGYSDTTHPYSSSVSTWLLTILWETHFALSLGLCLVVLSYLARVSLSIIRWLRPKHIIILLFPWMVLGIFFCDYLGADLQGASNKLSLLLHIDSKSWWVHYLLVIPLSFTSVIYEYFILYWLKLYTTNNDLGTGPFRTLVKVGLTLTGLTIYIANELLLEGDYFGIHFWLMTLSFQNFYLAYYLTSESTYPNQSEETYPFSYQQVIPGLILSLFLLVTYQQNVIPEIVKTNMSRQESSFGLKLLGYLGFEQANDMLVTQPLVKQQGSQNNVQQTNKSQVQDFWWLDPIELEKKLKLNDPDIVIQKLQQNKRTLSQPASSQSPIIILLTIDSLRADWFTQPTPPKELKTLANLAQSPHTWFTPHLFTPSTSTRFTLGAMIYGHYPSHLKWVKDRATHPSLAQESLESLWTTLNQSQVKTTYISTVSDIIRRNNGLGRGINKIINLPPKKGFKVAFSDQVINKLISHVGQAFSKPNGQLFYSHLMDAHHPFNAGKTDHKNIKMKHLAELALIDQQIHKLLQWLNKQTERSRVWLIISSDHGQGFGQHHIRTHNGPAYEHQARVPLWIHHQRLSNELSSDLHNGKFAFNTKDEWQNALNWSLIDLYPTILNIFSLPASAQSQGISWWPFLASELQSKTVPKPTSHAQLKHNLTKLKKRPLLSVNWYTRALFIPQSNLKIIEDTRAQTKSLYDLHNDPKERKNLCFQQKVRCKELTQYLKELVTRAGEQPIIGLKVPLQR